MRTSASVGRGGRPPLLRSARGQALSTAAAIPAKSISLSIAASVCIAALQFGFALLHHEQVVRGLLRKAAIDGLMRGVIMGRHLAAVLGSGGGQGWFREVPPRLALAVNGPGFIGAYGHVLSECIGMRIELRTSADACSASTRALPLGESCLAQVAQRQEVFSQAFLPVPARRGVVAGRGLRGQRPVRMTATAQSLLSTACAGGPTHFAPPRAPRTPSASASAAAALALSVATIALR